MKVIRLEEIDSTNSYAKSLIDDFEDKTVVHALRQTNGKGRLNRLWVDLGDNNLFFSIILKPSEVFKSLYSNITQYASVVLCNTLEKYGANPKIKWPNDVMIDGQRKISGILSETVMQGSKLKGLVVGIGINLNAEKSEVEAISGRVVTALNLETGKAINSEMFFEEFLNDFFVGYEKFLDFGFECIKDEYINRSCFLNKNLSVQILNDVKSGYAKGINNSGELLLQTEDNKELILNIGDIL